MRTMNRTPMTAVAIAAVALLGLTACTMDAEPEEDTTVEMEETETETPSDDELTAGLVGAGCEDYATAVPEGDGSIMGMSMDPVAVAASNNPLLTTLTAAVSGQLNPEVNLVDTLNGDEFTVFAPVDDAFAALDPATVESLKLPENAELLTSILTYHVVPGQIAPDDIEGTQTTVQGGTVEVTGSGDEWMVNGATVICGGVKTANATVYLIDGVLLPA
ncbi:fasciclin domain-containing protein [Salinibacterium sp. dk2585]|uniref:fasciclin domain-containing protein n=1 Tax=unclassified Salinibacterium TaxID=2632331 RepID=UPI0011C24B5D|nr:MULTISPECIES: fasciclin domain-containing protein [unclassified Salinibacterium]QEE62231.1 fasciclin domain-containing protein [Salinibacterium sp. dk2585]TXK53583.1 fasciclin domain-containing protein [Salinibacterium sp. dk5596]